MYLFAELVNYMLQLDRHCKRTSLQGKKTSAGAQGVIMGFTMLVVSFQEEKVRTH
jgi:hypothetical protein